MQLLRVYPYSKPISRSVFNEAWRRSDRENDL